MNKRSTKKLQQTGNLGDQICCLFKKKQVLLILKFQIDRLHHLHQVEETSCVLKITNWGGDMTTLGTSKCEPDSTLAGVS